MQTTTRSPREARTVAAIRQALLDDIRTGPVSRRRRLASERDLTERFGTTRITLREALSQLEAEGVIYREERRGWFVSPPRIVYNPLTRGYFDRMARDQDRVPQTVVIDTLLTTAPPEVSALMGLPDPMPAIRIRRARRIDERYVLYVEHYLRPELFPGILDFDLTRSITEIYETRYALTYGAVRFEMTSTVLAGAAASHLHVTDGHPALLIKRVNHDQHGRVLDCDLEYWRHDAILIRVDVGGDTPAP